YLKEDNTQHGLKNKSSLFLFIRQEEFYFIRKYLILLRKQEYHINNVYNNKLHLLMYFFYTARKNRLGNKINLNVHENCLGKGVTIYHTDIVINFGSFIGDYSKLHGSNCIGNNGINDKAPQIGSFVDIGYGAILIGNIKIADNI